VRHPSPPRPAARHPARPRVKSRPRIRPTRSAISA
jgi:hypothetical protein